MTSDQWFSLLQTAAEHLPEAAAILVGSLRIASRLKKLEQLKAQVDSHEERLTVLEDAPGVVR
jgi:ubiquinone biosynthesis protein UbiJ